VLRGRSAARAVAGADPVLRERYLGAWRRWLDLLAPEEVAAEIAVELRKHR